MKNLYQILACLVLCMMVHPLQAQFNHRYDPANTEVPSTLKLPYNVTSIADNNVACLTTANYVSNALDDEYRVIDVNSATGVPGSMKYRTWSVDNENSNSIVYSHSGSNNLKTGSRDVGGSKDMWIVKNDVAGGTIWARRLGVSAYDEEGLLIVQDDPSYSPLGTYLIVGVSNRYGTRSPYIARVEDVFPNTMNVLWQKTYNSGLNIDEIPTSAHRKANGDFVIAGHTEGSSVSTLFTFEIDIASGKPIGNWVNYHVSSQVDETNAYIQRSQSGAGGYVLSYTVGDATGSAIGVMEIDNTRNTVFWNNTYYETYSNFNHSVAIHWNGTHYVLGTGHFLAASGAGYPGFLSITVGGAVNSFSFLGTGGGTFRRTQSMIQTPSNDYIIKVLYDNLDGFGLIKTNSSGGGTGLCDDNSTVGVTPLVVDPDATDVDDDNYSGLVSHFESQLSATGIYYDCGGTPIAPYKPKADDRDVATVEEWDVPGHQLSGTPTSVSQPEATDLEIFPNPSNGTFQIQFGTDLPIFYEVTDMSGKTIVQGRPTSETESIHLKDAKAGMYLLKVQFANEQWTQKISVR